MAGGRLWGTLFFLFMTFASFSTVIAVFENIIACACEDFGWDRHKACIVGTAALVLLGLPCALGYNVWNFIQPMGAGSTVLDFEDFLVSNLLLPGGSLVYLLFCVTKWGWGFDKYAVECNTQRTRASGAARPPRPPIRKLKAPLATRTQYYCSRLTPAGLSPLLSRVFPRAPAGGRGGPLVKGGCSR